jgi:glutamate dehydrogenase
MADIGEREKASLIETLARRTMRGIKGAAGRRAAQFVRVFYARVAPAHLTECENDQLHGAAVSAWRLLERHRAGRPNIDIFVPDAKRHGWSSQHAVVQIANDDMPFLVDSVMEELNRHHLAPRLLAHPIVYVARDAKDRVIAVHDRTHAPEDAAAKSVMHVDLGMADSAISHAALTRRLTEVLADVRMAVADWQAMRLRMADVIAELDISPPPCAADDIAEARDFLRWLADNHFTFLGYREWAFRRRGTQTAVRVVPAAGLGLLRNDRVDLFEGGALPPDIADFVAKPSLVFVNKATRRSTVHRAVPLDVVGVKRFDAHGNVVGERLFAGLFTSVAYSRSPRDIPMLRRKLERVVAHSGLAPGSHDGKALIHILETLPRDELFQASEEDLHSTGLGVLDLQEHQRTALFVHRDPFGRSVSCLVYVPRDRYDTNLRIRFQEIIEEGFGGKVESFTVQLLETQLAHLHFIVRLPANGKSIRPTAQIEQKLIAAAQDWSDDLSSALAKAHGDARGRLHFANYNLAFPPGYRDRFEVAAAVTDIAKIEAALTSGRLHLDLYRSDEMDKSALRLKIYVKEGPLPLSDVLPMLENMGLKVIDEVPHEIEPRHAGGKFWIQDFGLVTRSGAAVDLNAAKAKFEDAFARIWAGEVENDGFNRLVLGAHLTWRQIVILRSYSRYLRQAGIPFSLSYMEDTLANNAGIAADIVTLFEALFDPAARADSDPRARRTRASIAAALEKVENADEDRILRRFVNACESSLRTNFYQPREDGSPKPYVSIKLDSSKLEELPLPRPLYEVMVYSPRVEAIHLRGGKVARGGIRWSDRREDFRTEILGLMKAQMTKNAVIVPVGAKGGFVVKRPPQSRDALFAEGVECYKTFMRGLLDITDNLVRGKPTPPKNVVRHDGDDPYLVVAADKGTATFSDIANGVARDYGFWLDDAFASGGSAGYDHKAMGITARGAWESVKRHFRELGQDIQADDFTCVGVGDMSGDVFGNAMLLSAHIKLIGAFNHLHIFVDPDPDPKKSLAERKRLFALPRSSWSDYDAKLISKGGGVFERRAKSIRVTEPMRKGFGLGAKETVTPNELIRAILRARVDLLFFGGIGTFVKSSEESDSGVGDRANDALRIDGGEVAARVVGEGANLGVTQLGRIEYALAGGRINTDFIDNSAGVDTSDHEVNIKILLREPLERKRLTRKRRDKMLRAMTEEIAELVLIDNYRQAMALTHIEMQGVALLDDQVRFVRALERAGRLNRAVEFLPDDETIAERRQKSLGFTRPELAVLLAYAKIALYDALLASDVPDDPFLVHDVGLYFPSALRKSYAKAIASHPLRREISATYLTNSLVNRVGASFVTEIGDKTGHEAPTVARAYLMARQAFRVRRLWAEIEVLDNAVAAKVQVEMNLEIIRLIRRATQWMLRSGYGDQAMAKVIGMFQPGIARIVSALDRLLPNDLTTAIDVKAQRYENDGVPSSLAHRIAALGVYASFPDIVRISQTTRRKPEDVARIYFALGARVGFNWLHHAADGVVVESEWQKLALGAVVDDLYAQQSSLTAQVLSAVNGARPDAAAVDRWVETQNGPAHRVEELLNEFRHAGGADLAMLTVAARELRALTSN